MYLNFRGSLGYFLKKAFVSNSLCLISTTLSYFLICDQMSFNMSVTVLCC